MISVIRKVCRFAAELTLRSEQHTKIGAIRVSSMREDDGHFASVVRGALNWIGQVSPSRYARAQKHLRWICCRSLPLGKWSGEYDSGLRMCSIDFEPFGTDDMDRAFVSLTIVHEAAHAWLLDIGIPYDAESRLRVESVCHREERLFASKMSVIVSGLPNWLTNHGVDTDSLSEAWRMSRWQQLRATLRRINECSRAEPDAAPNSSPPSQLPASLEVQSSDSPRTSTSDGCG